MSDDLPSPVWTTFIATPAAFEQRCLAFGNVAVAEYHADTDTVTFDWPRIEQEAANEKSYIRGIAKILLAAREARP